MTWIDRRFLTATGILAFIGLILLFFPAHDDLKQEKKETSGAMEALNLWAAQRAYPNPVIPDTGFALAWEQSRLMRRSGRGTIDETAEPWSLLGPHNIGGRTLCLALHPDNTDILFAGGASGGLWKSTTGGVGADAWDYVETGHPVLAVSTIAIDPENPDVMYIGTGEVYRYQNSIGGEVDRTTRGSYGIGILKSTDGGASWAKSLDWSDNQMRGVWMIAIHPLDSTILYAATTEGVYKSLNSGGQWTRVHDVIMATDVRIHPGDPQIVFAACGNFESEDHGIYRTTNGGSNWTKLTTGLPETWTGKTKLAIAASDPSRVYASISNIFDGLGLYRSTDTGDTWQQVNATDYAAWQGWYSHYVVVSPFDADTLFTAGIEIWRSINGGADLVQQSDSSEGFLGTPPPEGPIGGPHYVHADHHYALWHPGDPDTIFFASDGGIFKSTDGGDTFESLIGGYATTQFYNGFSCSATSPDMAMGGLQDNSSAIYEGDVAWRRVLGGDGCWSAINPLNDDFIVGSTQFLFLYLSHTRGVHWSYIIPPNQNDDQTAFIAPFVLCPSDPEKIFAGRSRVYKTVDEGLNWAATNSNEPLDGLNPVLCLAVSETNDDIVYAGTAPETSRSRIFQTANGGDTWTDVTGGLPDRYPGDFAVDPIDPDIAYVALMGYGTSHVFRTVNSGQTWQDIGQGLPDVPTSAVAVDPRNTDVIYVGTDVGAFVSPDAGQTWQTFMDGMPTAMIVDLTVFAPGRLIRAATHGNGVFEREMIDPPPPATTPLVITGPGPAYDNPPLVRVFPPEQDAAHLHQFNAYGSTHYGVSVSCGDLDGVDGDEILTGAGPGDIYGPHVRGFETDGTALPGLSFLAYGTNRYGVNVAAGDIDGDGIDEVITGAGPGAVFGPHVRAFDYDGTPGIEPVPGVSYFAYGTPKWGVNVAAGDIDGDGYDEILTGAGPGAVYGPHVRGWNVDGGTAAAIPAVSFLAYGTNKYGVVVTGGDVDGDGIDEIVTGPGPGGMFGAHVRGWNYDGASITPLTGFNFFAWQPNQALYGANVFAGADLNGDGRAELVVGCGPDPDAGTPFKVYQYENEQITEWFSLEEAFSGLELSQGTTVAAGRF